MQDNAPGHSVSVTREVLKKIGLRLIFWPPYSPGLNPIETVWNKMKGWIEANYEDKQWTYPQLRRIVQEAWEEAIAPEFLWETLCTMPQRCRDVIKARGYHTKW